MTALKPGGCLVILLYLAQSYCSAQDKSSVQFGKVTPADFTLPVSRLIDSSTNAVILSDIGSVHFVGNRLGWFSYVFQRQTRIKLLNKAAFNDLATVVIRLYSNNDDPETVDKVSASTYNLENGQVTETKLEKTEIFEDRHDKHHIQKKFSLPGVKEGSVIEYSYTITSNYYVDLPSWKFQQQKYPTLWSEYQVDIPQTLFYVLVKQGVHPYCIDKGKEGHEAFIVPQQAEAGALGAPEDLRVSANTVIHRWAMKDIPAFRYEPYLSTPENYLDKIDFQLSKTYNGEEYRDYKNTWKQATEELLAQEDFGKGLDEDDGLISDAVLKAAAGATSPLETARAVYYYVTGHFTCDNHYDYYVKTTLHDVMKKNAGTVGDINMLLIAMLRKAGLHADPVLLSTRDFGYNLSSYPVLQKLNYVIARLALDGKIYYLDAAHSLLGFGQLPGNCYNGHARIICKTDSGSVYFRTDSLKEQKTTVVFIQPTDRGEEGTWTSILGPEESFELRERLAEKGAKAYFKDIQTRWGEDMDISNGGIDSLDRPEYPVKVHYDFRLHGLEGSSIYYVPPMLGEGWQENPFKAAERKYPVEMPYVIDEMYVFTMQVPDGYTVDELPKSTRAVLNGGEGSFEYLIGQQEGMVQLRCHLKLNKADFSPDDYTPLRDFFALVVQKEAESIVLKKN